MDVVGVAGLQATEDDLELAVRLQAAIWSVADALIDRQPVPDGDREVLNELAAEPCLVPRLLPGPTRTWVGVQGVRSLMSSVARDAIDVFGGPRAARLKRCEGSRCSLLFVDTSRSGTPALVLHGALRQSLKGGGSSPPQEGAHS